MDKFELGESMISRRAFTGIVATSALALTGASLTGCTPPVEEEPVSLLVKVPRTGHTVSFDESITSIDQVIYRLIDSFVQNYPGGPVDINVEVFEQIQYDNAIVEAFGTNEAPDMLYGDYFNMSTYIHTGAVIPLDDVVTPGIRESIYPYLWDLSTVEDRVYMMPYLARQNILSYNKELFRQAGLESFIKDNEISSWSLEEWTYILDTLAEKLPQGVYPMMMYANSSQGDTHIMTLLRSAGSEFFDETGHFNISTPEGIAALRWIQEGVDRGWYPPHAENLEIEDCSSLFRGGQLAIYMVNNASIGRYGDTIGLVNFPGPDDDGCATTFVSGFEIYDNGDERKQQLAKEFLAYIYGNDDLMSYAAGTLPASRAVAERYGEDILAFDLFLANQDNVVDFTGSNPDTRAVREIFYTCIHDLLMKKATPEEIAERIDQQCNAAIDEAVASTHLHA